MLKFRRPILVYLPCYNCEPFIVSTIAAIPSEYHDRIEVLVVDNNSTDHSRERVLEYVQKTPPPFPVHLIRCHTNVDYPGSQKTAYILACRSAAVEKVVMLHGDGQYSPELLKLLEPYFSRDVALVQGTREKGVFGKQEETPAPTRWIIKGLGRIESWLTGIKAVEWHSGFVMYSKSFLEKVPLARLSETRHIDGEMIMCASLLGEELVSLPIWKLYAGYIPFGGFERYKYVWHVAVVVKRFKFGYHRKILEGPVDHTLPCDFDVLLTV